MKKLFKTLLLALAMMLALTGCSSTAETEEPTAEPTAEATATPEVEEASAIEEAVDAYYASISDRGNNIISVENFFAAIDAGEDMTILSIRKADDYAAGHIAGAVNAAWPNVNDIIEYLPMSKPVYVYCYSGQTAGQAVATLNMLGFDAYSVKYGFNYGISKVEGYEAYVSTEEAVLDQPTGLEFNEEILTAVNAYYDEMEGSNIISSEAANELLIAEDPSVAFVSIRAAADYAEGHIQGATNIPWGTGMSSAVFAENLPTDKKIIVNCYSGQTAGQTVALMRLLGYNAVSLKGGLGTPANAPMGWANEGYELVK